MGDGSDILGEFVESRPDIDVENDEYARVGLQGDTEKETFSGELMDPTPDAIDPSLHVDDSAAACPKGHGNISDPSRQVVWASTYPYHCCTCDGYFEELHDGSVMDTPQGTNCTFCDDHVPSLGKHLPKCPEKPDTSVPKATDSRGLNMSGAAGHKSVGD